MRIVITGSNGLLGQKIVKQLVKGNITFLATSKGENRNPSCPNKNYKALDITSQKEIDNIVNDFRPDVIINTAAMTNVDSCEAEAENCQLINVNAVGLLFNTCKTKKIRFIQLSTDFVFDGENGPYAESDKRNPLSIYAKSKVDAEDILLNSNYTNWSIIRTIIVFGEGENLSRSNIVLWAKSALTENKELTIVNDQFRAPTWADDLAWACIQIANLKANGVFHISGPETFSIFELVTRIAKFYNLSTKNIIPIQSETLNQKAKRPPKTGFIIEKAREIIGYQPMKFEDSLRLLS